MTSTALAVFVRVCVIAVTAGVFALTAPPSGSAQTDPYTAEYAYIKDGTLVQLDSYKFAMDGRSVTIATEGISVIAAGQRVDNIAVYDKQ